MNPCTQSASEQNRDRSFYNNGPDARTEKNKAKPEPKITIPMKIMDLCLT